MKGASVLLAVLLCLLLHGCAPGPTLATFSLDYIYQQNAAVALDARRLDGATYERLYLRVTFRQIPDGAPATEVARRYKASYQVGAGYDGNGLMAQDSLQLQRMVYLGQRQYGLTFNIAKPGAAAVVMFKVEDKVTGVPYVFDLPLPQSGSAGEPSTSFLVFNRTGTRPLFGPFARPGDTVSVRSLTVTGKSLTLRQYVQDYAPALPPMAATASVLLGGQSPQPVAQYNMPHNAQLLLTTPGIYVLSSDIAADPGQTLVVVPFQYPDVTRASELVGPLTYITTRAERTRLQAAKNPKREVDKFWLNIAGGKDQARRLIKEYYTHVEFANAWFTDYREGYKTDRGMVYIIFGKPTRVLRNGTTEEWQYDEHSNTPELQFTFERMAAPLGGPCLQLRRSPDYDKFWYAIVDQWRQGRIRR